MSRLNRGQSRSGFVAQFCIRGRLCGVCTVIPSVNSQLNRCPDLSQQIRQISSRMFNAVGTLATDSSSVVLPTMYPVVSRYLQCHQYLRFCKKKHFTLVIASLTGIIDGGQWPSWILNIVNFDDTRPFSGGELGLFALNTSGAPLNHQCYEKPRTSSGLKVVICNHSKMNSKGPTSTS